MDCEALGIGSHSHGVPCVSRNDNMTYVIRYYMILRTSCQSPNGPTHEQMDDGYASAKSEPNHDSDQASMATCLKQPTLRAGANSSDQAIRAQIHLISIN